MKENATMSNVLDVRNLKTHFSLEEGVLKAVDDVSFRIDEKKTLGLIRAGTYHFETDAPERMEIIAGLCRVMLDGETAEQTHGPGSHFDVPGKSGFTITVGAGLCEYICSFLS